MANEKPHLDVVNPLDRTVIERLAFSSIEAAYAALDVGHCLFSDRDAWLPAWQRKEVLSRFANLVEARSEDLARQASKEGGKPLRDSRVEIARAVEGTRVAIAEVDNLIGTEVPMRVSPTSAMRVAHTYREPRGLVLAISAFNHPFNLIIHQVITAIAAGCPVVVKPALKTPLSCRSVVDLLAEAGLPDGWCQMLLTADDDTERLVSDARVAYLSFIGSAKVGWHLRNRLAPGATCVLEHGGLAPVIIDDSADLDDALPLLTRAAFYHAGQVCVSAQRIYVERSISEVFTQRLVEGAKAQRVGDALDEKTDIGPLILPAEVDRVDAWVEEAVQRGGKLRCGGERVSSTTYAPTVVFDPPDDCKLSQQEVFGPVVAVYPYDDIDDAIARANAPDVFFQAALFTKRLDVALSVSRRLHGMAVMVNDHTAFRVDWMPFGGHRQSGLGVGGIGHSMRDMTLERLVVFRSVGL